MALARGPEGLAPADQRLVLRHCRAAMRSGSLSFFFASGFLPPPQRSAVRLLYTWCRACDDAVDKAGSATSTAERALIVDELRRKTWAAVRARPGASGPEFLALA